MVRSTRFCQHVCLSSRRVWWPQWNRAQRHVHPSTLHPIASPSTPPSLHYGTPPTLLPPTPVPQPLWMVRHVLLLTGGIIEKRNHVVSDWSKVIVCTMVSDIALNPGVLKENSAHTEYVSIDKRVICSVILVLIFWILYFCYPLRS